MSEPMLINSAETSRRVGRHVVTLKRWVQDGQFPPPIVFRKRLYWPSDEVDRFLERMRNRVRAEFAR